MLKLIKIHLKMIKSILSQKMTSENFTYTSSNETESETEQKIGNSINSLGMP